LGSLQTQLVALRRERLLQELLDPWPSFLRQFAQNVAHPVNLTPLHQDPGKHSLTARRNPLFPSMMARSGSARPRCFMSWKKLFQQTVLSLSPTAKFSNTFLPSSRIP